MKMKLIKIALLVATTYAAFGATAFQCTDYSTRAVATGAMVGAGSGAAVLVASGVAATVKLTATVTGGTAIVVALDCATTGCVATLAAGVAVGIALAVAWLANRNCAGAIVATNAGGWHEYWNRDAESWLLADVNDDYGPALKHAKVVGLFRHCGAAVVDGRGEIYFAQGKRSSVARSRALALCRKESSSCVIKKERCNT